MEQIQTQSLDKLNNQKERQKVSYENPAGAGVFRL